MFKNSRTGGKQIACPDVSITQVMSTLENTMLLVMSLCMMIIMNVGPQSSCMWSSQCFSPKRLCWRTPHPPAPRGTFPKTSQKPHSSCIFLLGVIGASYLDEKKRLSSKILQPNQTNHKIFGYKPKERGDIVFFWKTPQETLGCHRWWYDCDNGGEGWLVTSDVKHLSGGQRGQGHGEPEM